MYHKRAPRPKPKKPTVIPSVILPTAPAPKPVPSSAPSVASKKPVSTSQRTSKASSAGPASDSGRDRPSQQSVDALVEMTRRPAALCEYALRKCHGDSYAAADWIFNSNTTDLEDYAEQRLLAMKSDRAVFLQPTPDVQLKGKHLYTIGRAAEGDDTAQSMPVLVEGLHGKTVTAVSSGNFFTIAATSHGDCYTWGCGTNGPLGHGDEENVFYPKRVSVLHKKFVVRVSCRWSHCAVVTDTGDVYTWGWGGEGRLGHGDTEPRYVPTRVDGLPPVSRVSCGGRYTAVVTTSADVYMWGSNEFCQLAKSPAVRDFESQPVFVTHSVADVSCGDNHTMFLKTNGRVLVCGLNDFKQCFAPGGPVTVRNADKTFSKCFDVPQSITLEQNAVQISAGGNYCLALTNNGKVFGWGSNSEGQLGLGRYIDTWTSPLQIKFGDESVVHISAGGEHMAAVTTLGRCYTLGRGLDWQLGLGFTRNSISQPQIVRSLLDKHPVAVACGDYHTLVLCDGHYSGDLHSAFNNPDSSDFALLHQDKRYYTHRLILQARCPQLSPYIRDPTVAEAPIEMEEAAFRPLMQFIYTDNALIKAKDIPVIQAIATQFEQSRLSAICKGVLYQNEVYPPSSLPEAMLPMVDHPLYSDIDFVVQGERLHAHKFILAARCDYYRVMFGSSYVEASAKELMVDSMSAELFRMLLQFIYTDRIPFDLSADNAFALIQAASWLGLTRLQELCAYVVAEALDEDTVLHVLLAADMYSCDVLLDLCFAFLAKNVDEGCHISLDGWEELTQVAPKLAHMLDACGPRVIAIPLI